MAQKRVPLVPPEESCPGWGHQAARAKSHAATAVPWATALGSLKLHLGQSKPKVKTSPRKQCSSNIAIHHNKAPCPHYWIYAYLHLSPHLWWSLWVTDMAPKQTSAIKKGLLIKIWLLCQQPFVMNFPKRKKQLTESHMHMSVTGTCFQNFVLKILFVNINKRTYIHVCQICSQYQSSKILQHAGAQP